MAACGPMPAAAAAAGMAAAAAAAAVSGPFGYPLPPFPSPMGPLMPPCSAAGPGGLVGPAHMHFSGLGAREEERPGASPPGPISRQPFSIDSLISKQPALCPEPLGSPPLTLRLPPGLPHPMLAYPPPVSAALGFGPQELEKYRQYMLPAGLMPPPPQHWMAR